MIYNIKKGEYVYIMEEKKFWDDLEKIINDIRDNIQNIDSVREHVKELNNLFNNHTRNLR